MRNKKPIELRRTSFPDDQPLTDEEILNTRVIKQIITSVDPAQAGKPPIILGLADDNLVYQFDRSIGSWFPFYETPEVKEEEESKIKTPRK